MRSGFSRLAAALAFGPAAPVYGFLTGHEAWRDSLRALAALTPGGRILDVGIGPGGAAPRPGSLRIGLDLSARMLRRTAARDPGAPLLRADAAALPLADSSLDGVTGHSLLYLLPDAALALREMRRVLRPGGRVAFLEPRRGSPRLAEALLGGPRCAASMLLWRAMSGLHGRFDEASLTALLEGQGFRSPRAWPVLFGFGVVATAERPR